MKTLEDKLKAGEENANKLKEALALEKKLSSDKNSQVNAGAVVFVLTGARIRIRSLAIFAIKYLFQKYFQDIVGIGMKSN